MIPRSRREAIFGGLDSDLAQDLFGMRAEGRGPRAVRAGARENLTAGPVIGTDDPSSCSTFCNISRAIHE
jgi:hypothetical protein